MNKHFCYFIINALLFVVSSNVRAEPMYRLAIRGGVSLGSYESGVNRILLEPLKEGYRPGTEPPSFSGASAGALNALISAVDYCRDDAHSESRQSRGDNSFIRAWDIGIDDLMPPDKPVESGAIFTREALRKRIADFYGEFKKDRFKPACEATITFSVTRMRPVTEPSKAFFGKKVMRFVFPVTLRVSASGKPEFFSEWPRMDVPRYLRWLPADKERHLLDFSVVAQAAFASSAFPFAFQPVLMRYCGDRECNQATEARFVDGGIFDNAPIGVAADLAGLNDSLKRSEDGIIYIDPDSRRGEHTAEPGEFDLAEKADENVLGLSQYAQFLGDAATVGGEQILQAVLEQFNRNHYSKLTITNRRFPLVADYHSHFAAFYLKIFRRHDYLVGLFDGLVALTERACQSTRTHCQIEKLADQICPESSGTPNPSLGLDDREETQFITYLFTREFGAGACRWQKPEGNRWIQMQEALSQALATSDESRRLSFPDFVRRWKQEEERGGTLPIDAPEEIRMQQDPSRWVAGLERRIWARTVAFQSESTGGQNSSITDVFTHASPLVDAVLQRNGDGIWPLSNRFGGIDYSAYYGFDVRESAQVFSLMPMRVALSDHAAKTGWSLDGELSYHYLSADRGSAHYPSAAIWVRRHDDRFVFSTCGFGVDYAFATAEYQRNLSAVLLGCNLFGETLRIIGSHRLNLDTRVNERTENQFILQIDVGKTVKMLF